MMVKLDTRLVSEEHQTKELEFSDTTFTEVDQQRMQAYVFSRYGVRDDGVLSLHNLTYHTANLQLLFSNQARYQGDTLYLDGNVTLVDKEGFTYTTQSANYNQKTEILYVSSPFNAKLGQNSIKGDSLRYNAVKKEADASKIDAVLYTTKK